MNFCLETFVDSDSFIKRRNCSARFDKLAGIIYMCPQSTLGLLSQSARSIHLLKKKVRYDC